MIKNGFRQVLNLLKFNITTMVKFELIYKILSTLVFIPLAVLLLDFSMSITGYSYLTIENIGSYISNPKSLLMFIILILILTFFSMIDISAVIYIIDSSKRGKHITLKQVINFAYQNSRRVFRRKNFFIALFVLLILPVMNIGMASGLITYIAIPEFIMDFITANRFLSITWVLLMIGIVIFTVRRLYCFHYFTLEGCQFDEAKKRSCQLQKGHWLSDFFTLLILQVMCFILFFLVMGILIALIIFFATIFDVQSVFYSIILGIIAFISIVTLIIYLCLTVPISFSCISILYYNHKNRIGEKIATIDDLEVLKKHSLKFKIITGLLVISCVGIISTFSYLVFNNQLDLNIEYITLTEVSAHRGASINYPENTMKAFEMAVEQNADWIELDVQLTSDGIPVVMHDSNLYRITGVNKNIWEVTYNDIKDLDCSSWFSSEFAGERISTLGEILDFAKKEHIKLNIELKPTGHEKDFEKIVIDTINQKNFKNSCVVTSQEYGTLQRIKEYDQEIKTIYVMSIALGDITELTEADGFSVEASFITPRLVSMVHNSGKKIFAWTVNTRENMDNMIEMNVDNIVTDNIALAKAAVYESRSGNLVRNYILTIIKLFG
ncbi:glycerophosphodiester phosphodiesterase [Clostridium botulinum]|uniref:Glycerophosphodiester phosphodiesterase n=3 Tax=Clostridium botulinum TaxID=1491 RepID=A0A6B4JNX0_CLOBO|nr:glycerophosphodiester phosphodiesterase [Clostridium botulinum]MBY6762216.1 glycerophosphodiester phosphodiesterase [Clostridium botulinum]MBY6920471.1 glycerophosphodiester phosphodiesterase [Clostridium botulinum]MCR1131815.1 glycerophosphodiester phosphodiesterase [Clostridium botulinum]NFJ58315.1 glycerophosphodiester phosphodiesterase [Clostridium botulinum]NFL50718.1 glycerophosphodiester phosphodiesterase [Clostridium botulinum]